MSSSNKRLTKEYKRLTEEPIDFIYAKPSESNILEWHYIITGPPETPFEGGEYHGVLTFKSDYPFSPPAIKMITPNGRFQPNTRLCLSVSDYHPESWNPGWNVGTILTGLLSFMTSKEVATGCVTTTPQAKINYAKASHQYNRNNQVFQKQFKEYFSQEKTRLEKVAKDAEAKRLKQAREASDAKKQSEIQRTKSSQLKTLNAKTSPQNILKRNTKVTHGQGTPSKSQKPSPAKNKSPVEVIDLEDDDDDVVELGDDALIAID